MVRKSPLRTRKRPKLFCEVCGEDDLSTLQRHHIVERTEINTDNDDFNLAVLCASCHAKTHSGRLKIVGVFPGTRPPTGRVLVYVLDGVCNVPDLNEPYYTPQTHSMPLFYPKKI